jgi:hypothetical protein
LNHFFSEEEKDDATENDEETFFPFFNDDCIRKGLRLLCACLEVEGDGRAREEGNIAKDSSFRACLPTTTCSKDLAGGIVSMIVCIKVPSYHKERLIVLGVSTR